MQPTKRLCVLAAVCLFSMSGTVIAGTIIYIDDDAPPGGDGISWDTAFRFLQDALAVAEAGDALHIAEGLYQPDRDSSHPEGTGDTGAHFDLVGGTVVRGGYAGRGAAQPNHWDPQTHRTILSGDLNGDDGPGFENCDDNTCYVIEAVATSEPIELDGVVITGAYGAQPSGALNHSIVPLTIVNCEFVRNLAGRGGGISSRSGAVLNVRNTLFSGNLATVEGGGGAISAIDSSITVESCTFTDNEAWEAGGAILLSSSSDATITACDFVNNVTASGGALYIYSFDTTITACNFVSNVAVDGGALYISSPDVEVVACSFQSNTADEGGAIFSSIWTDSTVSDTVFRDNAALRGGCLYNASNASVTLTNCSLDSNWADETGGGIYSDWATWRVERCRFIQNTALLLGGGGIYSLNSDGVAASTAFLGNWTMGAGGAAYATGGGSDIIVDNCTIVANSADLVGGAFYASLLAGPTISSSIVWGNSPDEIYAPSADPVALYSDIMGGWPGEGNIDADPFFVDPVGEDGIAGTADDDLRLEVGSPCINAGDPEIILTPGEADLDGHARVFCDRVDMGAYEFGIGDHDCDVDVDLDDFSSCFSCITGPASGPYAEGCEACDFDYDLDVDLNDHAMFQQGFTGPGPFPPSGMVLIPAGEFEMGDPWSEGSWGERPVHPVYLSVYYIDRYEVTNEQYANALNWAWDQGGLITVIDGVVYKHDSGTSYPYCETYSADDSSRIHWDGSAFTVTAGKEDHPMLEVSWYGAVAYCNWRSAMEGEPLCYDLSTWTCNFGLAGFRLPTEAEWEKAAGWDSTQLRHFRFGEHTDGCGYDCLDGQRANYQNSGDPYETESPKTTPVGFYNGELHYKVDFDWPGVETSYQTQNAQSYYGCYDMSGNVIEWCNDWYSESYYSSSPSSNPEGPASGTYRAKRNGRWGSTASHSRSVNRAGESPDSCEYSTGFRCALGTP